MLDRYVGDKGDHETTVPGVWNKLGSAPTDGTRVLLYLPKYGPFTAHWDGGWVVHGCEHLHVAPSHWMKLPQKPKED